MSTSPLGVHWQLSRLLYMFLILSCDQWAAWVCPHGDGRHEEGKWKHGGILKPKLSTCILSFPPYVIVPSKLHGQISSQGAGKYTPPLMRPWQGCVYWDGWIIKAINRTYFMPPARICVAHNKMHRRRFVTKRPIQERLFTTETPGHGKLLQAVTGMSSKIPGSQK